jgi:hypothetical protein
MACTLRSAQQLQEFGGVLGSEVDITIECVKNTWENTATLAVVSIEGTYTQANELTESPKLSMSSDRDKLAAISVRTSSTTSANVIPRACAPGKAQSSPFMT